MTVDEAKALHADQPKDEVWHNRSAEDVLAHFGSTADGLSAQEAARRLATHSPNELKQGKHISLLQIFHSILIANAALSSASYVRTPQQKRQKKEAAVRQVLYSGLEQQLQ